MRRHQITDASPSDEPAGAAFSPISVAGVEGDTMPLSIQALHLHNSFTSRVSLSGDTPVPTPPISEHGGTHTFQYEHKLRLDKMNAIAQEEKADIVDIDIDGDTEVGEEDEVEADGVKQESSVPNQESDLEKGTAVETQSKATYSPAPAPTTPSTDFPEGGFWAYSAVIGATLVLLATFGLSNSFAVFQAEYKSNQLRGYPPSTISWIGSTHLFLTFGSSLVSGTLFDRGYFRYQLIGGSALWILGIFMLSLSKTFIQIFLSHSICLGLGVGICFGPCLSCIATYFKRKRSFMIGCDTSGAAVGAVVFPVMLNKLFVSIGFANAIRCAGYIMIILLAMSNLLLRPRQLAPSVKGCGENKNVPPKVSVWKVLKKFSREGTMWLVCGGAFCVMMGLLIPMFYIQVYAKSHGANKTLATYSLAIINATAFFARLCTGLIADRIGVFNAAVPCSFVVSLMIFAMLGATSTAGTIVFLILFGFSSGAFISVMPSFLMALADNPSELGLRSGVGFLFVAFAALLGSPIAGSLLTVANNQYWAPCLFGGAIAFVGFLMLGYGRLREVRRRGTLMI